MKYAIGLDIGGTKISMVLGSARGVIKVRRKIKTRTRSQSARCHKEIISNLKELIQESKVAKRDILGVGACLPGAVDSTTGKIPVSPHLPGWEGYPLEKVIKKELNLKTYLANDANAAAVAEKVFGQAKKAEHFIYMTVSTGVGGGLFVNGRLLEGANFVAGEIGHMTIETEGEPWALNEVGCLEAYASGTAIAKYVKKQLRKGKGSGALKTLARKGKLSAKELGELAKKGDKFAIKAFQRAGKYLGVGIGNLLNILNPELIILGGGVLKSAPKEFLKATRESTKRRSWKQAYNAVKIVKTKLGDDVGNLGALALVYHHHNA